MSSNPVFEYDVFISYSRNDSVLVERLSKRIRRYAPPRKTGLSNKKLQVFRDVDRLTASDHLPDKLKEKLLGSEWMALVCSPNTPKSSWVNEEVKTFTEHRGRKQILFVLHSGELKDCLPESLKNLNTIPLYIDLAAANRKKFRTESLRLIAALHKVDFMYLLREDEAKRRRITIFTMLTSLLLAILLFSTYLIVSTESSYWNNIEQPEAYWPNRTVPLLPINRIAINKSDPFHILYLGENAEWPSDEKPAYEVIPDNSPAEFDSMATAYLQNNKEVKKMATLDFSLFNDSGRYKGKGELHIWGILDGQGRVHYIRAFSVDAKDQKNNRLTFNTSPTLVSKEDHPFNIGSVIEKMMRKKAVTNQYRIDAVLTNFLDGTTTKVRYSMDSDELLSEGYESKEDYYGARYYLMSNGGKSNSLILGVPLDSIRHDAGFWKKIEDSDEWLTFKQPVSRSGGTFMNESRNENELISELLESLGDSTSLGNLREGLSNAGIPWDEDFLHFYLLTTRSEFGTTSMLKIHGEQYNRHDVNTTTFVDWLVRFSPGGKWKLVEMPGDDIAGLWPLDSLGKSALLLTGNKGFFITNDEGKTWSNANYNETSFRYGSNVKPFVLKGAVYAFIEWDTKNQWGFYNPLYRLEKRNLWQRWRTGLINLLE